MGHGDAWMAVNTLQRVVLTHFRDRLLTVVNSGSRFLTTRSLSRNRLHVFANHLEVTGLEVTKVGADNEHVAHVAE